MLLICVCKNVHSCCMFVVYMSTHMLVFLHNCLMHRYIYIQVTINHELTVIVDVT